MSNYQNAVALINAMFIRRAKLFPPMFWQQL